MEDVPHLFSGYGNDELAYYEEHKRKVLPVKVFPRSEDLFPYQFLVRDSQVQDDEIAKIKSFSVMITSKNDKVSGEDGTFELPVLEDGEYTIHFESQGYLPFEITRTVFGDLHSDNSYVVVALSPQVMSNEFRFVLTWADSPVDLDLHIIGKDGSHVYFSERYYFHQSRC